jgi:membrane-bound lytic murein transglycosylase MltF
MSTKPTRNLRWVWPVLWSCLLLAIVCGKSECAIASVDDIPPPSAVSALPMNFERRTGDLDEMIKHQRIRALVLFSRSSFFYVDGRPQGIYYEALRDFEQFVNQKLHTGKKHIQVTFIPLRPDQIESALTAGVGDLVAYGIAVTPEREQKVAFSVPFLTGVKQIVVTGKDFGPVSSLQGLSGKKVFVNPVTTYYGNLEKVNESLRKAGKPPILIQNADKNLMDEDLIEMVNAGILPATVTITQRAKLWASVLPNITPQPNLVIAEEGNLAFAMRKGNSQFKQLVDEFVKTRGFGTSFGNTLLRRYLETLTG